MLRVLLVTDSLDLGGAERHVVGLAAALVRCGHCVALATSADGGLRDVAVEAGVCVHRLGRKIVKRRFSPRYALALRSLVSREQFDVVHAHLYASSLAASVATLGTGIPLVLTEHSEAAWRGPRARVLSRLAYRRARAVVAVSESIRRRLVETEHVPPERVHLIPNALPDLPRPRGACLRLRRSEREAWIGVVARLQPEKGVADFLGAAARVAARMPQARFVIVGDGPARAELEAQSRGLGLEGRVCFAGFTHDVPSILEQLDMLAVPSRSEGTPLVILEAMQAAIPIVATHVGGIPEQIRDGLEGVLVQPGNPEALADALLTALTHPARAKQLAEAGRQRLQAAFDHPTMVRRTVELYGGVIEQAGRSSAFAGEAVSP